MLFRAPLLDDDKEEGDDVSGLYRVSLHRNAACYCWQEEPGRVDTAAKTKGEVTMARPLPGPLTDWEKSDWIDKTIEVIGMVVGGLAGCVILVIAVWLSILYLKANPDWPMP